MEASVAWCVKISRIEISEPKRFEIIPSSCPARLESEALIFLSTIGDGIDAGVGSEEKLSFGVCVLKLDVNLVSVGGGGGGA